MNCPNCGSKLKADVKTGTALICWWCTSCDYCSDYMLPSQFVKEKEAVEEWNKQRGAK